MFYELFCGTGRCRAQPAASVRLLLQHQGDYTVVESSSVGILQHIPYPWIVRDGFFVKLSALTTGADYLGRTLSDYLAGLSAEEREQFVDTLYSAASYNRR